jgi:Pyruvate-formate lyase
VLRAREETAEQIKALKELIKLGEIYGFDLSRPAVNGREAVQWTYLAYLAAVKEANGAAMSLGRVSSFLDIFIQRDIVEGELNEAEAQELFDHFVMKLRIVRSSGRPNTISCSPAIRPG